MNYVNAGRYDPFLYAAIAVLIAATFIIDFFTPLGGAEWVLYVIPCALAFLVWRPEIPVGAALICTILCAAGFFMSPDGIDPALAATNRTLGAATLWVLATTGFFFIRNKRAMRREDWLQAAHVGLGTAMGGEKTLPQLGDAVLTFLADYLDAGSAALFARSGDGFKRYGTYGVPADAPVPQSFTPDDGLLGQSVREARLIHLRDVPDGYLYFGSGLGRAKPAHLMIAPAVADGDVNAVIELGFNRAVNGEVTELLHRLSPSIGTAVRSARYRARLQELLAETQQQAEELQAQSEELRASNDELEQQSRALQDSQARLETQQSELEQTNAQLEEQTRQLEVQRDDLARAQSDIQAKAREVEQASRYKSEFLANMSHELRTPLNSLLIMARLLADNRDGNLSGEQVKFAQTIETSGNDLLTLINDVLDISKIEAGRLELRTGRVNTAQVVDKLKAGVEALARDKGLTLRVEIAPGAPEQIETDAVRLEQVMKNLLSNAVKFTDKGEVVLSVARAGSGRVAFSVRDTGIGIAPDQQDTIFEAFRQADSTISRKFGGTGLGLSISRELARLLGGDLAVDSAPGKGSVFTLTIPEEYDPALVARRGPELAPQLIREREAPPAERRSTPPSTARRKAPFEDDREKLNGAGRVILVVEDDPAFARILYDLSHELGFQCIVADTADEGVAAVRQYLPQAVILDIGLPDHTGLSVLDRVKRDLRTRHIPVHVVSVDDYTQTALALGATSYMLKPVKREQLVGALETLETRMAQRLRRVLIVEDDARQLESLRQLLASRDVEAVGAASAADCLGMLKNETFDCMVLDLSLPDASGFELLEQISHGEEFSFPPVIVYTGRELTADEEMRLRKYSKSIIIKGAKSPERLLDEVTLFLHQVVSELPEKQQQMLQRSMNRDAALEGRSILVVEDDVRNVFALTSILEPHGVNVKIARNGLEALSELEKAVGAARGDGAIDLVLMDIMMPEMDGLTAMREIRKRPQWDHLPVIALTAKAMANDQEQCLAAGANDYLAKPLDVDKLLSLVRVWMPR